MKSQINFAAIFKENRLKAGMSQGDLAKLIGISRPTLGAIEEGRAQPKASIVVNATYVFGYSLVDEFLRLKPFVPGKEETRLSNAYKTASKGKQMAVEYLLGLRIDEG